MNIEGVDYNYPYILFDPFHLVKLRDEKGRIVSVPGFVRK